MPSPYAHVLAGCMLSYPHFIRRFAPISREDAVTLLAFSLVADLDAIPGLLYGNIPAFHNQIPHTPLFAGSLCLAASFLRRILPAPPPFRRTLTLTTTAYAFHLFMDWLTYGRGLMLLWPFSPTRFRAPSPLFYGLRYSDGLLSHHHWITFLNESLVMALALSLALLFTRARSPIRRKP